MKTSVGQKAGGSLFESFAQPLKLTAFFVTRSVLTLAILPAALSFFVQATEAQITFQNLNFEAASLTAVPAGQTGGFVPITSALPGWTGVIAGPDGTFPQSEVQQNLLNEGVAAIDILGPDWGAQNVNEFGFGILVGEYSVVLQSGLYTGPPPGDSASIFQTGTIPSTAQSLVFDAAGDANTLAVSFAGNNLPLIAMSSDVSASDIPYTVYGADIAPYAGQTGQLEFTENYNGFFPSVELDHIAFPATAVTPEPSTMTLATVGGFLFGFYRRFSSKQC